jgi:phospholipid/cholesterol/gamma-HCH transport system substrate-binding protein
MDGLLDSDGRQALNDISGAAVELQAAAAQTRSLVARLDEPTTEFATTGLPQLREAISTLQSSASSLDRLVTSVESDPRGFLAKGPAREMELEP